VNTTDYDVDDDDVDDEQVWENMCGTVSRRTDVSIDRVKIIAENAGMDAYSHCGILDLLEIVQFELGRKP
jgi:hypothetical protein